MMALTDPARRPSAGGRRAGYSVAIALNAALTRRWSTSQPARGRRRTRSWAAPRWLRRGRSRGYCHRDRRPWHRDRPRSGCVGCPRGAGHCLGYRRALFVHGRCLAAAVLGHHDGPLRCHFAAMPWCERPPCAVEDRCGNEHRTGDRGHRLRPRPSARRWRHGRGGSWEVIERVHRGRLPRCTARTAGEHLR